MITVESFVKDISKQQAECLERFAKQRKLLKKRHSVFCTQVIVLSLILVSIAAGASLLVCLTKLQMSGMIILIVSFAVDIYFISHIKQKLTSFEIEFSLLCEKQIEEFDKLQQEHARQYRQIRAFQIMYDSYFYRLELIKPLIKQGLSEFEIGQIILDIRDNSTSADDFSDKLKQLKTTYNIKEND